MLQNLTLVACGNANAENEYHYEIVAKNIERKRMSASSLTVCGHTNSEGI